MPKAGGAFVYANEAFGPSIGFLGGVSQCIEFLFAPPAIAAAFGAYVSFFVPGLSPTAVALGAYLLFTGLNIYGVKHSAVFEVVITVLAVGELLFFAGLTLFAAAGVDGWKSVVFSSGSAVPSDSAGRLLSSEE